MSYNRYIFIYPFILLLICNIHSCNASKDPNIFINVACGNKALKPESEYWTICKGVGNVVINYNFKKVKLDERLSSEVFDKYLKTLDPSKTIFTEQDIKKLELYRHRLHEDILKGNLEGAYKIYNCFSSNYIQTIRFIKQQLESKNININSKAKLQIDRKEANWFPDNVGKNEYWQKRIAYDVISQKLIEKTSLNKAIEITLKRYENLKRYLESRKSSDVLELYMNAFTESVEPHTSYLSASSAEQFKIDMSKSLEGIGATLRTDDLFTKIEEVIKGGPAYKSKQIESGDRIIAVAQGSEGEFEDIRGLFIDEVVKKVRGPKGSIVRLRLIPHNASSTTTTKEIVLIRDKIVVEEQKVTSKVIHKKVKGKTYKIGLLTIPSFYIDWEALAKGDENYNSSSNDVKNELLKLQEEGIQGLIIDLQNNGGGSLPEAVALTGLFIGKGPVVQMKESTGRVQESVSEIPAPVYKGPLIVLTNIFSASASEIFAGAIQDYGRGIIFGSRTYGKGTVQTVLNVAEDIIGAKGKNFGQLNITIAQFYRVNGTSTQSKGVTPDIEFPSMYPPLLFGECANKNALEYNSIAPSLYKKFNSLDKAITYLQEQHDKRMAKSELYKLRLANIQRIAEARKIKEVSVNEKELIREREKEEALLLKQNNEYRRLLGLKAVKKGEKIPKLEHDMTKEEATNMIIDLINYSEPNSEKE